MDKLSKLLEVLKRKEKGLWNLIVFYEEEGDTRQVDILTAQHSEIDTIIRMLEDGCFFNDVCELWLKDEEN